MPNLSTTKLIELLPPSFLFPLSPTEYNSISLPYKIKESKKMTDNGNYMSNTCTHYCQSRSSLLIIKLCDVQWQLHNP